MCDRIECAETIAELENKIKSLEDELQAIRDGQKGFYCKICPLKKIKSQVTVYTMSRHLSQCVS